MFPVARGFGGMPIPRPVRVYFAFGDPIDPTDFEEGTLDERAWALREATRRAVETLLEQTLEARAADPRRRFSLRLARGLLNRVARWR